MTRDVSIIIPMLNEERAIGRCLESLTRLDFPRDSFEIILVDNGSTDRGLDIARTFSQSLHLTILQKTDVHVSALRNLGASHAKGKIFAFLDADCVVRVSWLKRSAALLTPEDVGVVGAHFRIPDPSGWVARAWYGTLQFEKQGDLAWVPGCNTLVTRDTFERVGGFDESIETNEDCEFCYRVSAAGLRVIGDPAISVVHLGTPQTLAAFYRKNRWHATDGLRVFLRDLPKVSNARPLLFAFYTLLCLAGIGAGIAFAIGQRRYDILTISLIALAIPAFLLSARLTLKRKRWSDLGPLTLLHVTYGIARSQSLLDIRNWSRNGSRRLPASGPTPAKTRHIPSLDGLRALSIILVLLGHLSGTRGFGVVNLGIGDYAHLGVVVFFVISGFLITNLLLSEQALSGGVSLARFYERRALRLFPASYAYVACVSLLWLAGIIHLQARDLWHATTYTVNYLPHPAWEIGHLWSLSVEEQFYLLWPFTIVLLGPRKAMWAAGSMIVLGPIARAAAWLFLRGTPYRDLNMFPMVADSLAMGCLLARTKGWFEGQRWYLRLFHPVSSFLLLALILLLNRTRGHTVVEVFGTSIMNVGLAILIHRSVYHYRDWAGRLFNLKPVAFVGVLSYSLYLWQQLFLNRYSTAWTNAFPQNLLLAVGAALGSYLLLEKPLLKWRQRLRARS